MMSSKQPGVAAALVFALAATWQSSTVSAQTCTLMGFFFGEVTGTLGRKADIDATDFNGDGIADLLMVNDNDPRFTNVYIRPGSGSEFDPFPILEQLGFGLGDTPQAGAAGDVNADGHIDMVIANGGFLNGFSDPTDITPDTISVVLGNGDFTFAEEIQYTVGGSRVRNVELADVDNDGDLDAVTVELNTVSVSVMINDGTGAFTLAQSLPNTGGDAPFEIEFVHLDCDRSIDFVTRGEDALVAYLNDGTGVFTNAGVLFASDVSNRALGGIATADFNRDGLVDLVTGNAAGDAAIVLFNNGDGTVAPLAIPHGGNDSDDVAVGDFNGDYIPDIAIAAGRTLWIIRGNGDGTFQPATNDLNFQNRFEEARQLIVADIDGILGQDIVVRQRGDSNAPVVLSNQCTGVPPTDINDDGAADFTDILTYLATAENNDLAADTNNDGLIDETDVLTYVSAFPSAGSLCTP